ncbi:hypothetical protein GCM10020001_044790 [Nonomuraea salmonea]
MPVAAHGGDRPGTHTRMSSADHNAPKNDAKRRKRPEAEHKPAGRQALERALSESGKALEDLIGGPAPA